MRPRGMAGVLAGLLGVALVGGCTTPGTARKSSGKAPQTRQAEWSIHPSEKSGKIVAAQAIGTSVVVVYEHEVAVLDRRTGKQRWSVGAEFPNNLQPAEHSVRVTPDALVLLLEPEPGRHEPGTAIVYDLATGKKRATRAYYSDGTAHVAVTADTLLVETGTATNPGEEPATYALESVDLKTGRQLWSHDYGDLRPQIQPGPGDNPLYDRPRRDPLLAQDSTLAALRGYEKSGRSHVYRTRIIDPRTGRTVGDPAETPQGSTVSLLDDRQYAVWDNDDGTDCGTSVSGYQMTGDTRAWQLDLAAWRNETRPECTDLWEPMMVERRLLTYTPEEHPILVDPASGKTVWTGPEGFYPIGVAGDVVAGRDSRGDNAVVAYDISRSRRLWDARDVGEGIYFRSSTVVPGYLILAAGSDEVWTYHLRTGKKLLCAGAHQPIGAGDGWLVAGEPGDTGDKSELRYFAL